MAGLNVAEGAVWVSFFWSAGTAVLQLNRSKAEIRAKIRIILFINYLLEILRLASVSHPMDTDRTLICTVQSSCVPLLKLKLADTSSLSIHEIMCLAIWMVRIDMEKLHHMQNR